MPNSADAADAKLRFLHRYRCLVLVQYVITSISPLINRVSRYFSVSSVSQSFGGRNL